MSPSTTTEIHLSDSVKEALGRTWVRDGKTTTVFDTLSPSAKFLVALNAKATRTGSPLFAGISHPEKARRRAAGRVAKASRKTNRAA